MILLNKVITIDLILNSFRLKFSKFWLKIHLINKKMLYLIIFWNKIYILFNNNISINIESIEIQSLIRLKQYCNIHFIRVSDTGNENRCECLIATTKNGRGVPFWDFIPNYNRIFSLLCFLRLRQVYKFTLKIFRLSLQYFLGRVGPKLEIWKWGNSREQVEEGTTRSSFFANDYQFGSWFE